METQFKRDGFENKCGPSAKFEPLLVDRSSYASFGLNFIHDFEKIG
jgi:hypothetical protein